MDGILSMDSHMDTKQEFESNMLDENNILDEFLDTRLYDQVSTNTPSQQDTQQQQQQHHMQLQSKLQTHVDDLQQFQDHFDVDGSLQYTESRDFIYGSSDGNYPMTTEQSPSLDQQQQQQQPQQQPQQQNHQQQHHIQQQQQFPVENDFQMFIKTEDEENLKFDENLKEDFCKMVYDNSVQSEEFERFDASREELLKLKFGGNNKNNDDNSNPDLSTDLRTDSFDVTTSSLPLEYTDNSNDSNLMYKLEVKDLPSFSRVETQMKLQLIVTPAPPEFLLHLPRDTIAKPKLTLESNVIPDSVKPHMLFFDTYVVGTGSNNESKGSPDSSVSPGNEVNKLRSCNVCKRCMRRELKRASRRKSGVAEDFVNWNLNVPRRAIIFNCKEVISFPRPTGNTSSSKSIELLSRIICYCRHHQEPSGFRLLIVLKDHNDKILGKTLTPPIMIMDRKKSLKGENTASEPQSQLQSRVQSPEYLSNQTVSSNQLHIPGVPQNLKPLSPPSIDDSSSDFTSASVNTVDTVPTSIATLTVHNNEDPRAPKRQKRSWSPTDNSSGTYYDSVVQQRSITNGTLASRQDSVTSLVSKRDPLSPASSENLSPQNNFGTSSGTSVFSATPEKKVFVALPASVEGSSASINNNSQTPQPSSSAAAANFPAAAPPPPPQNVPTIQRIIPAQGPIRGGVEVTLLGCNFRPGLSVKFGASMALATHCWSDSTIVTYLPPASQAGPVLVTFEDMTKGSKETVLNSSSHQIFTYTDDSDRQLIELALQIVGLKMNGKLEDAKNIAKRIIGNNNGQQQQGQQGQQGQQQQQQQQQTHTQSVDTTEDYESSENYNIWLEQATLKMKELSKTSLNHEGILLKFLSMLSLPNSPITVPNWAVCTLEGQTMLHLACIRGYYDLCKFLIKNGSKLDFRDSNDFTPLHFALINGHRDIIKLLVRYRANGSMKLNNGLTLMDISDSNVLDLIDGVESDVYVGNTRRLSNDSMDSVFDDDDEPRFMKMNKSGLKSSDFYNDGEPVKSDYEELSDEYGYEEEEEEEEDADDDYDDDEIENENDNESYGYQSEFEADYEDNNEVDSIELDCESLLVTNHGSQFNVVGNMQVADTSMDDDDDDNDDVDDVDVDIDVANKGLWNRMTNAWKRKADDNNDTNTSTQVDVLPSYDDLFPNASSSLRALMNFRSPEDNETKVAKQQQQLQQQQQEQSSLSSSTQGSSTTSTSSNADVIISLKSSPKTINSDTRLLFFWFPFMLFLLLVLIGNQFNLITSDSFTTFSSTVENFRTFVGEIILGKRHLSSLYDNLNYGRERMNNLLNDVNDVVYTAVAGR
ncbi:hypothetical protein CANARDRAFT_30034 [[Candida] arabinofermentans NRRL YB-2248]|uniref:IPT/TIG domain-containing protein n=1 Tax=[Candida] arabinofermentans NRRL YB-2248 TaxID=983967 RepID=A0A1E4SVH9_9ASCO|nr:hypothetical protein CANARDRAFT_30034 [[Candida] arabinofermentans NRRL YB-2248]